MAYETSGQHVWHSDGWDAYRIDQAGSGEWSDTLDVAISSTICPTADFFDSDVHLWQYLHQPMLSSTANPKQQTSSSLRSIGACTRTGSTASETSLAEDIDRRYFTTAPQRPPILTLPALNNIVTKPSDRYADIAKKQCSATQARSDVVVSPGVSATHSMSETELTPNSERTERRRAQNRCSQRRYRERKDARVQAAEDEVNEWKKCYFELQDRCNNLIQENLQLRAQCEDNESATGMKTPDSLVSIYPEAIMFV